MREVIVTPNKQLQEKYDRFVEIVAANPGISAAQIGKQYYGELTSDRRQLTVAALTQLCHQKRIEYHSIDSYRIPVADSRP